MPLVYNGTHRKKYLIEENTMNADIQIANVNYNFPEWINERNGNAEDHYGQMFLKEIQTGADAMEEYGDDWRNSEAVTIYAEENGISVYDVKREDVENSMFAWFSDYDEEDHDFVMLIRV